MSYKLYKHLLKSNYRGTAEKIKSLTKPKNYDSKTSKK